ncbi:MAG: UDP-N-acetylmuramoyl-tripeptide--D-alanyl-D-alanine ligase [Opitutales bacterium]
MSAAQNGAERPKQSKDDPEGPFFEADRLAEWTKGQWLRGIRPSGIEGFHFDTRVLEPGGCFLAVRGEDRDGHEFLPQAAAAGAAAAIVERGQPDLGLPQLVVPDTLVAMAAIGRAVRDAFPGPVVGITGSCGKTSTREILKHLLDADRTHASPENWNNRIGAPMTLFGLDPDRFSFGVMEAGINQPGEMEALGAAIHADHVLLTHIGPAHLEALGSEEKVAEEKMQLLRHASANASLFAPAALLRYSAVRACAARAIFLAEAGEEIPAADAARIVRYRLERVDEENKWDLWLEDDAKESFPLYTASRGIARNAALALVVARELGVPEAELVERLAACRPSERRGEIIRHEGRFFYIDCYNANPASMRDALDAFERSAPAGAPRCYVIGAMDELGDSAEPWHREVTAEMAARPDDWLLAVGPRHLTTAYLEGARQAGFAEERLAAGESVERFHALVRNFEGAVFLKGSRSYALEKLLSHFKSEPQG